MYDLSNFGFIFTHVIYAINDCFRKFKSYKIFPKLKYASAKFGSIYIAFWYDSKALYLSPFFKYAVPLLLYAIDYLLSRYKLLS